MWDDFSNLTVWLFEIEPSQRSVTEVLSGADIGLSFQLWRSIIHHCYYVGVTEPNSPLINIFQQPKKSNKSGGTANLSCGTHLNK